MGAWTIVQSYTSSQPFLLLLIIFGPSILSKILSRLQRRPGNTTKPPSRPNSPVPIPGKVIISLHTLYRIYQLLYPPFNLFIKYSLPLYTSSGIIRQYLLNTPQTESFAPALSTNSRSTIGILLNKLENLDNRLAYFKYGHEALLGCAWCLDKDDYMIFNTSIIIWHYIQGLILIGLLSWGIFTGSKSKGISERWRTVFALLLVGGLVGEVGGRYLWEFTIINGDTVQLDSVIHTIRTLLLLLIPIIYINLPTSNSPDPSNLFPILSNLTSTIRLNSLFNTSISQDPALRDVWIKVNEEKKRDMGIGKKDEFVRQNMERLGMREDEMRMNAERWVGQGLRGVIGDGIPIT